MNVQKTSNIGSRKQVKIANCGPPFSKKTSTFKNFTNMNPQQEEKQKDEKEVIVLPISFGNPSNEIIDGELRLSKDKQYANETVAMINIPTEIDLKEIFAFLQKSDSSLKMTHMKILNQEQSQSPSQLQSHSHSNTDLPQSFYAVLCSFTSTKV